MLGGNKTKTKPQPTKAASVLYQGTGCFSPLLSLKDTMDCSSKKDKNHLHPLYLYFSSTRVSFSTTNCPSLLVGKAGKGEREGNGDRELRNYSAKYMLVEKNIKVLCRFSKPVLSMATKQGLFSSGNNCQLTLDLPKNTGVCSLKQ